MVIILNFKIAKIQINNFFGYKEAEFVDIKDYNVLTGQNNAGKSNLFRIFIVLIRNFESAEFDRSILYDSNTNERAEIKLEFDLDINYRRDFFIHLYDPDHFSNAFHPSHISVSIKFYKKQKFENSFKEISKRKGIFYNEVT